MNVEDLAAIVTNEMAWINGWLLALTVLCVIGIATMAYKLYKQSCDIDDLTYIIDRMDRELRRKKK